MAPRGVLRAPGRGRRRVLRKGSQVYVEGSLRTRKWQDKQGNDRYSTEIVGNELQMLGAGAVGAASAPGPARRPGGAGAVGVPARLGCGAGAGAPSESEESGGGSGAATISTRIRSMRRARGRAARPARRYR